MKRWKQQIGAWLSCLLWLTPPGWAEENYQRAAKRALYLLNGLTPRDHQLEALTGKDPYLDLVRGALNDEDRFYTAVLRYHEKLFGVGLPLEYIDELLSEDIDHKENKFAQITCETRREDGDLECWWASDRTLTCPETWRQPASVFWYPGVVRAWVCPAVARTCGSDLSRCFVRHQNEDVAAQSELGVTQAFDSRYAVVKSLGKQSAGIATAVVMANYPYTHILEPGLTAVDGAIAHFYRQKHHFRLDQLSLSASLLDAVDGIPLTDTKFHLIYTGEAYEHAGVLTTFGWLRRYEKNRTRANELYERLLCRQFTAELPRIFPQDPGNLREAPGCSGCHATLDPLADFFRAWGEGGDLYGGQQNAVETSFSGQTGSYVADLAHIIRSDSAFSTCAVQNVWEWLIGREFYAGEADVRRALTDYFIATNYSMRELIFAVATHPTFVDARRTAAVVTEPLSEPPLGEPPGGNDLPECTATIAYATDIAPHISLCTRCHDGNTSLSPLLTQQDWQSTGRTAVAIMSSGEMPPEQAGPPRIGPVYDFKEAVRCWIEQGGSN